MFHTIKVSGRRNTQQLSYLCTAFFACLPQIEYCCFGVTRTNSSFFALCFHRHRNVLLRSIFSFQLSPVKDESKHCAHEEEISCIVTPNGEWQGQTPVLTHKSCQIPKSCLFVYSKVKNLVGRLVIDCRDTKRLSSVFSRDNATRQPLGQFTLPSIIVLLEPPKSYVLPSASLLNHFSRRHRRALVLLKAAFPSKFHNSFLSKLDAICK